MSEQRLQFLLLAGGGKGCWERHRMTQIQPFTVSRQVFWKMWQLQRSTDRCTLNDKCEEGWGEDYGAPPQPLTFTGPWYRTNGEAFTGLHQSLKKTQLIHSNKSKLLTFPWYHAPLSLSLLSSVLLVSESRAVEIQDLNRLWQTCAGEGGFEWNHALD